MRRTYLLIRRELNGSNPFICFNGSNTQHTFSKRSDAEIMCKKLSFSFRDYSYKVECMTVSDALGKGYGLTIGTHSFGEHLNEVY